MSELLKSRISNWLQLEAFGEEGLFKTTFQTHHLGNVFIRSLHGGVTGATIEMAAESMTRKNIEDDVHLMVTSAAIDYLRITKDSDLFARAKIVRISRRMSVVDVECWQDSEDTIVARGVITLKVDRPN